MSDVSKGKTGGKLMHYEEIMALVALFAIVIVGVLISKWLLQARCLFIRSSDLTYEQQFP